MGDPANKQETKTEKPMTSVPVVPRKDPNNKSPLDGKKITPTAPSKPQGLWFKKLVNKVGPAGHKLFFTLQTLGGVGLAVSGYAEGNSGRMSTGLLNTSRNFIGVAFEKKLGPLKKIDPEMGRAGLMTAALGSNLPQFASAVTLAGVTGAEIMAATCVVAAYSILSIPGWVKSVRFTKDKIKTIKENRKAFAGKKVETTSEVQKTITIKKEVDNENSLSHKFRNAARNTMHVSTVYVAPMLLFARAGAQLVDGIIRKDIGAIAAGTAFVMAPLTLLLANKHHRNKIKEMEKEQQQKLIDAMLPGNDKNKEQDNSQSTTATPAAASEERSDPVAKGKAQAKKIDLFKP